MATSAATLQHETGPWAVTAAQGTADDETSAGSIESADDLSSAEDSEALEAKRALQESMDLRDQGHVDHA
jgi:hypothetical protein